MTSFGLLKPRFVATPAGVTITRNVWLPFVLLALAAPGIGLLVQSFSSRHFDGALFGLGFAGTMIGFYALVITPWFSPGRITITRDGVTWGGTHHPRPTIRSIGAHSSEVRTRNKRYLSWSLSAALTTGKPLVLLLGTRSSWTKTDRVVELDRAVKAALHG